jgi:hypothetical protein
LTFFAKQTLKPPSESDYWILDISAYPPEAGSIQPNGTLNISLNESGKTVTAKPFGWNDFMYWELDGKRLASRSLTAFVPRQEAVHVVNISSRKFKEGFSGHHVCIGVPEGPHGQGLMQR